MCCQRSVYSCKPYTEGFEYAIKMRAKELNGDPINGYDDGSIEHRAFNDGYRDGLITIQFHQIEEI